MKKDFPINEINENDKIFLVKSVYLTNKKELNIPTFVNKDNEQYKVKITNDLVNDLKTKSKDIKKIRFGSFVDLDMIFNDKNNNIAQNFLFFNLEELILEDGITTIPSFSFGLNPKLVSVILPNTLIKIGKHAFKDTNISKINLTGSLKEIEVQAFSNAKLKEVYFALSTNNSLKLGLSVFELNLFEKFTFPKNITEVIFDYNNFPGNFIFDNCKNLKNVFSSEMLKNSFYERYADEVNKLN